MIVGEKMVGGRLVKVAAQKKKPPTPVTPAASDALKRLEQERHQRDKQRNADRASQEAHELRRRQAAYDLAVRTGHFHDDPVENEIISQDFKAHPEKYPRPT